MATSGKAQTAKTSSAKPAPKSLTVKKSDADKVKGGMAGPKTF